MTVSATTGTYPLSLHDALPIYIFAAGKPHRSGLTISMPAKSFSLSVTTIQSLATAIDAMIVSRALRGLPFAVPSAIKRAQRSEEHTSELQSLTNLVCRLLLEKE